MSIYKLIQALYHSNEQVVIFHLLPKHQNHRVVKS